jgi:hypothetical protein
VIGHEQEAVTFEVFPDVVNEGNPYLCLLMYSITVSKIKRNLCYGIVPAVLLK